MAEFRDGHGTPASPESATSAEELYNQGMAFYRRRQWQQARESFLRLKAMEPNRRGIDALLDELDIFIRLESLEPPFAVRDEPVTTPDPEPPAATHNPGQTRVPVVGAKPARRARPKWLLPALLAAVMALVAIDLAIYGLINPPARAREQELRNQGQAYRMVGNWDRAIEAYEELHSLLPNDLEAKNGLWIAYYERANQHATDAARFEEQDQYAEAAQEWDKAIADFKSAQEVDPNHHNDSRGSIAGRIELAEKHNSWAMLFAQADQQRNDHQWSAAIQTLEALRNAAPDYRSAQVRMSLSICYLSAGQDAVNAAETASQVEAGVKLMEQAFEVQPSNTQAQTALQKARSYLEGMDAYLAQQWDDAIKALAGVVEDTPGYAGGRARDMLCQSYTERATRAEADGNLQQALADYQSVVALNACSNQTEAAQKVQEVSLALTPTVTPTPRPTDTPRPTATPTNTPEPTATPTATNPPAPRPTSRPPRPTSPPPTNPPPTNPPPAPTDWRNA